MMESTGAPEKIQISEESRTLLRNEFPQYAIEVRGSMDIKVFFLKVLLEFYLGFWKAEDVLVDWKRQIQFWKTNFL